jgi:DNA-binding NarL/FixJ family response regulator
MNAFLILIADDHDLIRRGLKSLLEGQPGWQVCGEAKTGTEALQMTEQFRPQVAVLDITMPGLNGLDVTRRIRKISPQTEVLLVSAHYSDQLVKDSFEVGALGYLLKSDSDRDLVKAVKTVAEHKPFYTARATEAMLAKLSPSAAMEEPAVQLTSREREILQLVCEGKVTKEIAALLNLSVKTAETHRSNIMRKLKMHSIGELVRYAVQNRIIEP